MSRRSKSNVLLAVTVIGAGLAVSQQASAQSMSPWGMWDDERRLTPRGNRPSSRTTRSYEDPWFDDWDYDGDYRRSQRSRQPKLSDRIASGGAKPAITPRKPQQVAFKGSGKYAEGSIVIDVKARKLYFVRPGNIADLYRIGVGRDGFRWNGVEKVSRVANWPDWHPPKEMRKREPHLPAKMTGGIKNPLGARAIYLGETLYRIHGTNNPKSIGTAQSSGCFRMMNEDVAYLVQQVKIGAEVHVVKSLANDVVASLSDENVEQPATTRRPSTEQTVAVEADPAPSPRVRAERARSEPRQQRRARASNRDRDDLNDDWDDDWAADDRYRDDDRFDDERSRRAADYDDYDPEYDDYNDDTAYFDRPRPERRRY